MGSCPGLWYPLCVSRFRCASAWCSIPGVPGEGSESVFAPFTVLLVDGGALCGRFRCHLFCLCRTGRDAPGKRRGPRRAGCGVQPSAVYLNRRASGVCGRLLPVGRGCQVVATVRSGRPCGVGASSCHRRPGMERVAESRFLPLSWRRRWPGPFGVPRPSPSSRSRGKGLGGCLRGWERGH